MIKDRQTQMQNSSTLKKRKVIKMAQGKEVMEGAGVRLKRVIGNNELEDVDPFLLLDEFRSDKPDDYIAGFPTHPHRGFETVTYMIEGFMEHKDSTGKSGVLKPGGAQWMTAGSGILHSEIPKQQEGLLWGFQLWVNLPADKKMTVPRYQNVEPEDIPESRTDDGVVVKVIAGKV
ncbi:Pirin, partial [hydrothermal vent metagenome]